MTRLRLACLFMLTVSVVSGAARAQPQTSSFVVPSAFAEVEPFVRTLERGGLKVQRLEDGQLGNGWASVRTSAFIETDHGDLKVAVLPKNVRADRIGVIYTRDTRKGIHSYRVTGVALNMEILVDSGTPLYFTIDTNWIVETRDAMMDAVIKRVLGQIADGDESPSRTPR